MAATILKQRLLRLLEAFVQVCTDNQLRYYLAYGSVLGAVRHKGMIPWDDDIDVHMPREDYEKLQKLPQSVWEGAILKSWRVDKSYQCHFMKLEDTHSTVIEHLNPLYVGGVYIDIFPLDIVPSDITLLKEQLASIQRLESKYDIAVLKNGCDIHGLKNYLTFCYRHKKYLRQSIQEEWEYIANRYNASQGKAYLDYHQMSDWHKEPMPIEWFGEGKAIDYEGRKYIVPENYDAYLTHIYGDYMTPPPEDKREGHEYLYVNLDERVSDIELKTIVRDLRKKVAFRFSWKDEITYWETKFKIK